MARPKTLPRTTLNPSFRTRLMAIVAVPLAGMLAFAVLWTLDRWQYLEDARDARERVTLADGVSDVVVEVRSTSMLAPSVGDPGLPEPLRDEIDGRYAEAAGRLEIAMAWFVSATPELQGDVEPGLLRQIDRGLERRQDLENRVLRRAAAGEAPGARAVAQLFLSTRSVSELLGDAIEQLTTRDGVTVAGTEVLGDIAELPGSVYAETEIAIEALSARRLTPRTAAELVSARTAAASLAEELESELPGEVRARFDDVDRTTGAGELVELTSAVERAAAAGREPPVRGQAEIATVRLAALAQIQVLDQVGEDLADVLDQRASASIASARNDLIISAVVTVVLVLATIGLVAGILRSVSQNFRALIGRANEIQQGDLGVPAIPERGPEDIRVLTRSFNEMAQTLRGVGERAEDLAAEPTPEPPDRSPLPGAIGRALDASVARLATVTRRLRAREAFVTSIVDTAPQAVWAVDSTGVIRSANGAAEAMSGYPADQMVGRPASQVVTVAAVEELIRGNGAAHHLDNVELELPHRDGHAVPASVRATTITDEDGLDTLMVFAFDITERYEQERRLEHEATHDSLTGLPNRLSGTAAIAAALAAAPRQEQGCTVLFIDLDNFKHFNDALGHAFGDRILIEVANRLRANVKPTSTVARLGGDEFVVVALTASPEAAAASARRIIRALEQPVQIDRDRVWVSGSIGVAWSRGGRDTAEDMLRDADTALFRAKDLGPGNCMVFDSSMRRDTQARAGTETALRRALASGGLADRYQPLVDLRTRSVVAAELLTRLPTPYGDVRPGQFIQVAEETGAIVDLGRWALTTACRRLAQLDLFGAERTRISVNISSLHLMNGQLIRDVSEAAAPVSDIAGRLGIEITESFLLRDERGARETLAELREMGVVVSLDDFGTGYSSLAHMRDLPIDEIKIDRGFVARMEQSELDRAIVEAVANLADARDVRVVAEGIETESQAVRCRDLGCDLGQGFLFSPAASFDRLQRALRVHPVRS